MTEAAILPPPHVRQAVQPTPRGDHPFAALVPGRVVHYVMRDGQCRAGLVVYVQRARGRMVQVGLDTDDDPPTPIMRQEWLLPDNGACTLNVQCHRAFDAENTYPMRLEPGQAYQMQGVLYEPAAEWEEDGTPGTWHWIKEHER